MAMWLVLLALPALVTSSRFTAAPSSKSVPSVSLAEVEAELATMAVPEATRAAMDGWVHKKAHRYVILTLPDLDVTTGDRDKNYADFRDALMNCPGVCFGGFDFEWDCPRGGGSVHTDEPAMFTWAPDQAPEGLGMMAFMKLKMQMPMRIDEVKKSMGDWNGAFIQCNSEAELHPDWVVPKLRGGRMGSRKDMLNDDGKALWSKLASELEMGSSGDLEPVEHKPHPAPAPSHPTEHHVHKHLGGTGGHSGSGGGGMSATSKDQIMGIIAQMVDEKVDSKKSEILEAAKESATEAMNEYSDKEISAVAAKAAKAAVKEIFRDASRM